MPEKKPEGKKPNFGRPVVTRVVTDEPLWNPPEPEAMGEMGFLPVYVGVVTNNFTNEIKYVFQRGEMLPATSKESLNIHLTSIVVSKNGGTRPSDYKEIGTIRDYHASSLPSKAPPLHVEFTMNRDGRLLVAARCALDANRPPGRPVRGEFDVRAYLQNIKTSHINIIIKPSRPDSSEEDVEDKRHGRPMPPFDEQIRELFAGMPEDYKGRATALSALNTAIRQNIAEQLAPALNAHIQAMPHDTYEEKKELARWVNGELRRFDLAIKGPTGEPSILLVMTGDHPEIGRFIIEHKTPEGKRVRPVTSTELPHLELMEAAPRREAFLELREKGGQKRGGGSRA